MTPLMRFAGIALFAVTVTACGGGGDTATPQSSTTVSALVSTTVSTPASSTPASTTTSTPARVEITTTADLERIATRLGLECSDEESALFCNRGGDSWQFRISPNGDGDAAFRRAACQADATYNSSGAITDGRKFVVYAGNDGQNVEGFRDELAAAGVPNLEIERGC